MIPSFKDKKIIEIMESDAELIDKAVAIHESIIGLSQNNPEIKKVNMEDILQELIKIQKGDR